MPWAPIGKMMPRHSQKPLAMQTIIALALEAGTTFLRTENPTLADRVTLVSIRNQTVHALATSAAARAALLALRERLLRSMRAPAGIPLMDVRVEIRGSLAEEPSF